MGKKQLLTTDLNKFLAAEYAFFQHIFKTQEQFESEMKQFTMQCECGGWYWLSCSKRCDCNSQPPQKVNNHASEKN